MDMRGDLGGGVICLVTAEMQGEGVLIKVRTSAGPDHNRQDRERSYVDADEAVAAVSELLHAFTDAIDPPSSRPHGELG